MLQAQAERQRKEREERLHQLLDWRTRKQQTEADAQTEELRKSLARTQANFQRSAFLKHQRDQVVTHTQASLSALKRSEKEARLQEEAEAAQNYFAERAKAQKKVADMLEQQRLQREADSRQQADLHTFCARQEVVSLLREFDTTLALLFTFYAKVGAKDPLNAFHLSMAGLARLSQDFRLVPALLSAQDLVQLFRLSAKGETQGLEASAFRDWLVRVALQGLQPLARIAGHEVESSPTVDTLRALFTFMGLTPEERLTAELLKKLSSEPALHPLARKQLLRHAN